MPPDVMRQCRHRRRLPLVFWLVVRPAAGSRDCDDVDRHWQFQVNREPGFARSQNGEEYDDALYGHLRGLTQGIKELELTGRGAMPFLRNVWKPRQSATVTNYVSGMGTYILSLAYRLGFLTERVYSSLRQHCEATCKGLNGLIRSLRSETGD